MNRDRSGSSNSPGSGPDARGLPSRTPNSGDAEGVELWFSLIDVPLTESIGTWRGEAVIERYRAAMEAFDCDHEMKQLDVRDQLAVMSQIPTSEAEVLDVGCGLGHWSKFLTYSPAPLCTWRYAGMEISDEIVKLCRSFNPGIPFHVGTAEDLPFRDGSYDVVLSSGVLTYTSNWQRALRECARVSRRYVVLLRTPIVKYRSTTRCRLTVRSPAGKEVHSLTLFARDEFLTELSAAGLSVLHQDYGQTVHRAEGLQERIFWLNYLLQHTRR